MDYEDYDQEYISRDAEPQKPEPKISSAEIIFLSIFFLILDIVDWFEFGMPGTDVLSWTTQFYFNYKGVSGTRMIVGNILELIPGVDYLPIRTLTFWLTAWVDRHPKTEGVLELASKKVPNKTSFEGPALSSPPQKSTPPNRINPPKVAEEDIGAPKGAFKSIEEENFGINSNVVKGPWAENTSKKELPEDEEKEHELEKALGGGQLKDVEKSLGEIPYSEPEKNDEEDGEIVDLRNQKKAA